MPRLATTERCLMPNGSAAPEGRLVWISAKDRKAAWFGYEGIRKKILDAYEAAPSDPAEAIAQAWSGVYEASSLERKAAQAVLRALGVPSPPTNPEQT